MTKRPHTSELEQQVGIILQRQVKYHLKESILVMIMMYNKTKEVLKTQWNIGRHGFVRGQD